MAPDRSDDAAAAHRAAAPEALLAALAQQSEGVIVADVDGRITFVNAAAERLHGVARLDVTPEAYAATYQLLTEDGAPYPSTELPLARAVLRGEQVIDARWRIQRPDGSVVHATGTARPLLDPAGRQLGAVLTVRDDGARVAAAAAEGRAARILEQVSDAHVTLDAAFRFVTVNPSAERVLGKPRDALLGRTHWEAFPASVGTPVEAAYRRVAAEGGEAHLTHRYVGEGYDVDIEIDAYATEMGGVAVFWRDVTARVRAQEALRTANAALAAENAEREAQTHELELTNLQLQEQAGELEMQAEALQATAAELEEHVETAERARAELAASERQFHTLADAIPTLAWTAQPDGAIDWYNARWYEYTGTTPEQMTGWGWQSVHDATVLPDVMTRWQASIATGAPFEMTFPLLGADGHFRPFLTRVAPVRDAAGAITRWFGTNTDLSVERAGAEALAASEARFRTVQDASPDGFQVAEAVRDDRGQVVDFIYRYLNPAGLVLTGRTVDDMLGRRMLSVFPSLLDDPLFAEYVRVAETGAPCVREVLYEHDGLDGGFRVVVVRVDDGTRGTPVQIALSFSDITARLQAEAEARMSAARLRRVLDTSPAAVMEFDAAGRVTYVNSAAEAVLGIRGTGVTPAYDAPAWGITTPDGDPIPSDALPAARALRGEIVRDFEHTVVDSVGARRVIRVNAAPIRDTAPHDAQGTTSSSDNSLDSSSVASSDGVTGVVAAFFDVTAAREASARTAVLHALATALATATTVMDVGHALLTYGARPLGAKHATLGLLVVDADAVGEPSGGQTLEIVLADTLPDATRQAFARIPLDEATRTALPFAEAAATGRACYVESPEALAARYPKIVSVAEGLGVCAIAAVPLVVAEGTPEARILGAVVFDFASVRAFPAEDRALLETVARQAAQAMDRALLFDAADAARAAAEAARARADEANQTKSQFLANMSHELRTPLNAIGGYVQLLEMELHGPVTPEQRAALGRVQGAQQRLLGLITDILNHAKLESGRVEYDVRAVDVRDVVAEIVPLVERQLLAKGLAFDVRMPEAPCLAWADREKLGQVLVNLLSNATKFTDAPGRVAVHLATRAGRADAVFLRVIDTGRGIPRTKQDAIFEPFVQVQTGYARATEGTGLGLAISRDLARGMGGDLRVRSVEGEGSTFTVTLRRGPGPLL